jgi:hypothetical protein
MRISSRGTVSMSLTGWIIAAPFIAIVWMMVVLVKVTVWLVAALVTWLSQRTASR